MCPPGELSIDQVTVRYLNQNAAEFDRYTSLSDIERIRGFLIDAGLQDIIRQGTDTVIYYTGELVGHVIPFANGCASQSASFSYVRAIEFIKFMGIGL